MIHRIYLVQVYCLLLALLSCAHASPLPEQELSSRATSPANCKLPAVSGVYLSTGFGFYPGSVPSVGTLRTLMIYVDFPDAPATETKNALYGVFMPGAANWYQTASYGQLTLAVSTNLSGPFLRMPARSDSYGFSRGITYQTHQKYIQDALDVYLASGAPQTAVDVLYIVPTKNAPAISFSPTFMAPAGPRKSGAKLISNRTVTLGADAYNYWGYKVINHETGHTMGLPDYYPFSGAATGTYLGGWDLMADILGVSPDYLGWDKWRLKWITDSYVTCITTSGTASYNLSAIESFPYPTSGSVKILVIKRSSTRALVAEVRSNQGVDGATCTQGVLIYSVATDVATGNGPIQIIDAKPNSGGCSGQELNDAVLSLSGKKSLTTDGVTFTLTGVSGSLYSVTVTS